MRIAIVHDWMTGMRGGEKVVLGLLELFPGADLFTLVYRPEKMDPVFQKHKVKTSALQSRATGGVAAGTYLFALPGSPSACRDGWEEILRWQLDSRFRPCNLVELMPRLTEHLTAAG